MRQRFHLYGWGTALGLMLLAVVLLTGCPENPPPPPDPDPLVRLYTYEVVEEFPHDPAAFTQGLAYVDGELYEGTGLRRKSKLRRVDLATGTVQQEVPLPDEFFGEGIAILGERIYQLTWQNKTGFVYEKTTFESQGTFQYPTEGWGLTHDGTHMIMSDGTSRLFFRDPETFAMIGAIQVTDNGVPVNSLNELEYVDGEVYANVWKTDRIAIINPDTGEVRAWIDLTGLLPPADRTQPVDVLNGIAYDAEGDRLLVTGKLWPKLFHIRLIPVEVEETP
jgi:glutamine cyclotransferase